MQQYLGLFDWWVLMISLSTAFLILVSIYLYSRRRVEVRTNTTVSPRHSKLARDFVFVWVLLGLLVSYIVSISQRSTLLFAIGNIVVELILLLHIFKNKI